MTEWEFPVPPSAIISGPLFSVLPGQQCSLIFYIENNNFEPEKIELMFNNVEFFSCTYKHFLTSKMIESAYGKVVCLKTSRQLQEMGIQNSINHLKHYIITFDFGPCYEVVSENFQVSEPNTNP